jgi:hypothetical protein
MFSAIFADYYFIKALPPKLLRRDKKVKHGLLNKN